MVFDLSACTVASGNDFLMSLCDLRIGAVPFAVEEDLVVVVEVFAGAAVLHVVEFRAVESLV